MGGQVIMELNQAYWPLGHLNGWTDNLYRQTKWAKYRNANRLSWLLESSVVIDEILAIEVLTCSNISITLLNLVIQK